MVQRWPRDVERFQPDLVLLLYGGFINGWLVDGQPLDACDPAYRAHYGASSTRRSTPSPQAGPGSSSPCPPTTASTARSRRPTPPWTASPRPTRTQWPATPTAPRILRLDLFACPTEDTCDSTQVDGRRLRFDGLHYRDAAARLASQWILDQLVQPAA